MNSFVFTKPEWLYKFNLTGGLDKGSASYEIYAPGRLICKLDGSDFGQMRSNPIIPHRNEMEANARLIAAAPSMAYALNDLANLFSELIPTPERYPKFIAALKILKKACPESF